MQAYPMQQESRAECYQKPTDAQLPYTNNQMGQQVRPEQKVQMAMMQGAAYRQDTAMPPQ